MLSNMNLNQLHLKCTTAYVYAGRQRWEREERGVQCLC